MRGGSRVALDIPDVLDTRSDRTLVRVVKFLEVVERCVHAHTQAVAQLEHVRDLVKQLLVVEADSVPVRDDGSSCRRLPKLAVQEGSWCEQKAIGVDGW